MALSLFWMIMIMTHFHEALLTFAVFPIRGAFMRESIPIPLEMHPVLPIKRRLGSRAPRRRRPPGPLAATSGVAEWAKKRKPVGTWPGS